jgi:hypothetical protein
MSSFASLIWDDNVAVDVWSTPSLRIHGSVGWWALNDAQAAQRIHLMTAERQGRVEGGEIRRQQQGVAWTTLPSQQLRSACNTACDVCHGAGRTGHTWMGTR